MTLDAQDWVWRHSRARGNPRLVLLAIADKTTGPEAEARMGTAELRQRLGAVGQSVVIAAVTKAVDAGELEIIEPAKGSRAALYRLPRAVDYVRLSGPESGPQTAPSGPESGPQTKITEPYRSGIQTTTDLWSGIQTTNATASGPESGPQTSDLTDHESRATRAQASSKNIRMNEGMSEGAPAPDLTAGGIPPFARPLVDAITAADVYVGWDLTAGEWLRLDAMLKRSGTEMLARHAVTVAARQAAKGQPVSSARYFLRAWTSLPPAPTAGTIPAAPVAAPTGSNVVPFPDQPARLGRAAQAAQWYAQIIDGDL